MSYYIYIYRASERRKPRWNRCRSRRRCCSERSTAYRRGLIKITSKYARVALRDDKTDNLLTCKYSSTALYAAIFFAFSSELISGIFLVTPCNSLAIVRITDGRIMRAREARSVSSGFFSFAAT